MKNQTRPHAGRYARVVFHSRMQWTPNVFHYAYDTEIRHAMIQPTEVAGLVRVQGKASVWCFGPDPEGTYRTSHWHLSRRFPFFKVEHTEMPLPEAVKKLNLSAYRGDYTPDWYYEGEEVFDKIVPVAKLEIDPSGVRNAFKVA